ncbi:MAG: CBS domain-containing protein [Alphaproteobacteria bacterium]|nr:CBS domain-containing protein [Alphaproteobacteria bacterium]
MPCHSAMTKDMVSVSSDQLIEDVLALMKKKNVDAVPVVDEEKKLVGLFSIHVLMKNLLPVSVAMVDGVQIDMSVQAAPGIAKRLRKVSPLPVSELMDRKFNLVYPETPIWEGVNFLIQYGSPLFVVERKTEKLLGVITLPSALDELQRLKG